MVSKLYKSELFTSTDIYLKKEASHRRMMTRIITLQRYIRALDVFF